VIPSCFFLAPPTNPPIFIVRLCPFSKSPNKSYSNYKNYNNKVKVKKSNIFTVRRSFWLSAIKTSKFTIEGSSFMSIKLFFIYFIKFNKIYFLNLLTLEESLSSSSEGEEEEHPYSLLFLPINCLVFLEGKKDSILNFWKILIRVVSKLSEYSTVIFFSERYKLVESKLVSFKAKSDNTLIGEKSLRSLSFNLLPSFFKGIVKFV